jgi:hypothetical protein
MNRSILLIALSVLQSNTNATPVKNQQTSIEEVRVVYFFKSHIPEKNPINALLLNTGELIQTELLSINPPQEFISSIFEIGKVSTESLAAKATFAARIDRKSSTLCYKNLCEPMPNALSCKRQNKNFKCMVLKESVNN